MSGAVRLELRWGDEVVPVEVREERGVVTGTVGGAAIRAELFRLSADEVVLRVGGVARVAAVWRDGPRLHVALDGDVHVLEVAEGGGAAPGHASEESFATSPMTGTVAKVSVAPGAAAAKGAELFVVEAMKMEYVVRAPRDVTVAEVRRAAGERVALGDVVVTFAEPS